MEAVLQSEREKKIANQSHCRRNKTIIKKFGIISSRISLISKMLMEEEQTWNTVKTKNWDTRSKKSANSTASYCGMSIHCRPQSESQPLKTLDLFGRLKRWVQVKGPSARRKIGWLKKGNMCLSIVYYGKWRYPNINDELASRFLKLSLYEWRGKKMGVEIVLCTWYMNILSC